MSAGNVRVPKGVTVAQAQRRELVASLVVAKTSYREIARFLQQNGYPASLATISKDVNAVIEDWQYEARHLVDRSKAVDVARLEEMVRGMWPAAIRGVPSAVRGVLSCLELKARILGYASYKVALSQDPDGEPLQVNMNIAVDAEIAEMPAEVLRWFAERAESESA